MTQFSKSDEFAQGLLSRMGVPFDFVRSVTINAVAKGLTEVIVTFYVSEEQLGCPHVKMVPSPKEEEMDSNGS